MKIENQVTSLETSKKLKELGVEQESLWFYTDTRKDWKDYNCVNGAFVPFAGLSWPDPELELNLGIEEARSVRDGCNNSEPLSAFTASEILNLAGKVPLFIYPNGGERLVQSSGSNGFYGENIVEALAACLIHLKENKLI